MSTKVIISKDQLDSLNDAISVVSNVTEARTLPEMREAISQLGGSTVTVDSELSTTSENPVQNKVITSAINLKANDVLVTTTASGLMSSSDKSKLDYTNIAFATCPTSASATTKIVSISGNTSWELTTGAIIGVKFSYTNTAVPTSSSHIKLNVNNTGAKDIYFNGTAVYVDDNPEYVYGKDSYVTYYMYDGTNWVWMGCSSKDVETNQGHGFGYGTCTTASNTTAKTATLASGKYKLVVNGIVSIRFTNDVVANSTLSINSQTAKPIYYRNSAIVSNIIHAGDIATFIYNGTSYILIAIDSAEVNQNSFANIKIGSTTIEADTKQDTLEFVAGSNVTLTPDATNDKITIAATDTTYSDATTSSSGLMSSTDKTKLNGIAEGAQVNPVITPVTGSPTANQTPSFGGTFTVSQISQSATGQISATDRTVTIPSTEASTSAAGLMSSSDKTKLNGISTGAEANQNAFSNITVGNSTISADSETSTLGLIAGSNVTLTPDTTNDTVTVAATDTTYSVATTSSNGLMSSGDKYKLNMLPSVDTDSEGTTLYYYNDNSTSIGEMRFKYGEWYVSPDYLDRSLFSVSIKDPNREYQKHTIFQYMSWESLTPETLINPPELTLDGTLIVNTSTDKYPHSSGASPRGVIVENSTAGYFAKDTDGTPQCLTYLTVANKIRIGAAWNTNVAGVQITADGGCEVIGGRIILDNGRGLAAKDSNGDIKTLIYLAANNNVRINSDTSGVTQIVSNTEVTGSIKATAAINSTGGAIIANNCTTWNGGVAGGFLSTNGRCGLVSGTSSDYPNVTFSKNKNTSGATVLRANNTGTTTYTLTLPNSTGTLAVSSSDIRLKENIKDVEVSGLDLINKIKLHQFDWLEEGHDGAPHWNIGVIADELEELDPNLASGGGYEEDGSLNVKSIEIPYLLGYVIGSIQEISAKLDALEARIDSIDFE